MLKLMMYIISQRMDGWTCRQRATVHVRVSDTPICTVEEDEKTSVVETDAEDERVDWRCAMIRMQIGSLIREKSHNNRSCVKPLDTHSFAPQSIFLGQNDTEGDRHQIRVARGLVP